MTQLPALIRREDGATATEYVLLLVGVALILIIGALFLGGALNTALNDTGQFVQENSPDPIGG